MAGMIAVYCFTAHGSYQYQPAGKNTWTDIDLPAIDSLNGFNPEAEAKVSFTVITILQTIRYMLYAIICCAQFSTNP